jgi:6,7-dimethyl-8-ribityllumazine synthase
MSDYVIKDEDFSSIRKDLKVAIVTAEFNEDYTSRLEKINVDFLKNQ